MTTRRCRPASHLLDTSLVLLLVAALGSACGGDAPDASGPDPELPKPTTPTPNKGEPSLCPDAPSPALAVCLSFATLDAAGGTADVGGLRVSLEGQPELVPGLVGRAMAFDGDDDRLLIQGFATKEARSLTVQAWVKPLGEQKRWASLIDFWKHSQGFWLGASDSPGGWEIWSGGDVAGDATNQFAGSWQHVSAVIETPATLPADSEASEGYASVLSLYINGKLVDRVTQVATPTSEHGLAGLFVAGRGDRSDFFKGLVDELQVWTEARSAEQICGDAGGSWQSDSGTCNFPWTETTNLPVKSPCDALSCGKGKCLLESGEASCLCGEGMVVDGDTCRPIGDPCIGVTQATQTWRDWYRDQVPAKLVKAADAYPASHVHRNKAFTKDGEAWTVLGLAGVLKNVEELACLGFFEAARAEPENPVTLNNAATCMAKLGWTEDARTFFGCSLHKAPQNASAIAGLAQLDLVAGDSKAALKGYEKAAAADPQNPEWRYQAMQLALKSGDKAGAQAHLAKMPASNAHNPSGYRGALPDDGDPASTPGYCCPCNGGKVYDKLQDCTNACGASLGCFTNICTYSGSCNAALPFSFGLKLCLPPIGVQVCISFDTNGNIGLHVGIGALGGVLSATVGLQLNAFSGKVSLVVDAGTSNLPLNVGGQLSVDLGGGRIQGSVGLGSKSGAYAGQVTLIEH